MTNENLDTRAGVFFRPSGACGMRSRHTHGSRRGLLSGVAPQLWPGGHFVLV